MGPRQVEQAALFYEFSLDGHVPEDHLLRSIDRFVDRLPDRQRFIEFNLLEVGNLRDCPGIAVIGHEERSDKLPVRFGAGQPVLGQGQQCRSGISQVCGDRSGPQHIRNGEAQIGNG